MMTTTEGGRSGTTVHEEALFNHVAVLGCGIMGSGIIEVLVSAGVRVTAWEVDPVALRRGKSRVAAALDRSFTKSGRSGCERDAVRQLVEWTTNLDDLADCDLLIEAVTESESVKIDLFRKLDLVTFSRDVVMATNTSSIPVIRVAVSTSKPQNVVGMHFFNPVPIMQLVEVIPSLVTSSDVTARISRFVSATLDKTPVSAPDRAGFIVNALLIPYILDAIRMVESGLATANDIDNAMRLGCSHPMGPLALADLIGLDTVTAIAESLYRELGTTSHLPPPTLRRMVEAGRLGRKTERGFHAYTATPLADEANRRQLP